MHTTKSKKTRKKERKEKNVKKPISREDGSKTTDNVFKLVSVQANVIKRLVEALKEILVETNISITKEGIKLIAPNPDLTIIVDMILNAESFEVYECTKDLKIGLNIMHLFKLTRTIVNGDTLTLYIDNDDETYLGIRIENEEYSKTTEYKLNLIDIDEEDIGLGDEESNYRYVITVPSSQFQKICREANNLAETIEIKSVEKQLIFVCTRDYASH